MKICKSCGEENIDEAEFCRNCGEKLVDSTPKSIYEPKVVVGENKNSIITRLFLKKDKHDGHLRFAKTKSISILVFIGFFLFGMSIGSPTLSIFIVFILAIIFGLIFAVPVFIIGTLLGFVLDRLNY